MNALRIGKLAALGLAAATGVTWAGAGSTPRGPDGAAAFSARLAADRKLRRTRHPLTVKLIDWEGKDGRNVPVTLSVACGEGDYPAGRLCPAIDGKPLAAQVDVLATWPGDGSIKHALVSVVVPELAANGRITIRFRNAPVPAPPRFRCAVEAADLSVRTVLEAPGGERLLSTVGPETMRRIAAVLGGTQEPGALAPRLRGPVCYEFELHDVPAAGGRPDPDLDVFYRLRFYSGLPGARIATVVEHTRLPAKPLAAEIVLRDRDFAAVRFEAGPAGKLRTLARHGPLTHWWGTRYRVLRWHGRRPPILLAKPSLPYLVYAQFFPKIGAVDEPLPARRVAALAKAADVDPRTWPDGRILAHGPVYRYMPASGGRADIGPYALWQLRALASESLELYVRARGADGNGVGSFPVHFRDPATRRIGLPHTDPTWPRVWYGLRNGRALRYVRGGQKCPHTPDFAHHPSAGYFSYLATGDRFFEEEMLFWAMRFARWWPFRGLIRFGQIRADAWTLRTVVDAHFVLPDGHPRKAYLADRLKASFAELSRQGPEAGRFHTFYDGARHISGRRSWPCSPATSNWQYTWLIWSLDNAARKGWAPQAAGLRDWGAKYLIGLYTSKDTFTAPNGRTYRASPAHAMSYNWPLSVETVEWLADGREKAADRRRLTNFAEMYYYCMVNSAHEYVRGDRRKLAAWLSALPKRRMRPENWPLPAEIERRFQGERIGRWHDYGNGACSAALARSGLPGAEEMYRFVRAAMDHAAAKQRGPRDRAVEFVK